MNPPEGLYKWIEQIDAKFDELSKLNSVLQGERPAGDPTLGEIEILKERGESAFAEPLLEVVRFERALCRMLLWIAQDAIWTERLRQVQGDNAGWEISSSRTRTSAATSTSRSSSRPPGRNPRPRKRRRSASCSRSACSNCCRSTPSWRSRSSRSTTRSTSSPRPTSTVARFVASSIAGSRRISRRRSRRPIRCSRTCRCTCCTSSISSRPRNTSSSRR
jgi:hypothetical protein